MKKLVVLVALIFTLCLPALAQQNPDDQPATKADIQRYLEVMHSREMMNQMVDAMVKPMQQAMHDQYIKQKDVLPPDFEARMDKMMNDMLKEMPWDEILQAMAPIYQKHFTKGDINALVTFYSSPTGQKMLREMPALMADSMSAMMPIVQKHVTKVTERMEEEVTAMLHDSQKSPGSASRSQK